MPRAHSATSHTWSASHAPQPSIMPRMPLLGLASLRRQRRRPAPHPRHPHPCSDALSSMNPAASYTSHAPPRFLSPEHQRRRPQQNATGHRRRVTPTPRDGLFERASGHRRRPQTDRRRPQSTTEHQRRRPQSAPERRRVFSTPTPKRVFFEHPLSPPPSPG